MLQITPQMKILVAVDYLNQLQLNAADVLESPDRWMPWNYREQTRALSDAA